MRFLIVGAGFSGLVAAHRLSNAGHTCTIVDRRPHLAGNAHDSIDQAGVLVHNYGPHYFRSNSQRIVDYLSDFTDWNPVDYKIKSFTEEKYWPFPINLNTFEELIGKPASASEFESYLSQKRHDIPDPKNSEEVILSQVGSRLYELFFEGYTLKQWKRHPRDLDPSVCGRIPIRTNRDDRYLSESFQALPKNGYTTLLENVLAKSPNTSLHLETDFQEAREKFPHDHLIFTGAIDEYFNRCFGALPYRSLRFEHESFTAEQLIKRKSISGKNGFWQPAMQINYPEKDIPFTRIVEIKHATGQRIDTSTIVREFPDDWDTTKEPYYPVPASDATA
ncbi:MAG: UDP-galactopyranose mutase, partial [Akkermansiaceae bacterium]